MKNGKDNSMAAQRFAGAQRRFNRRSGGFVRRDSIPLNRCSHAVDGRAFLASKEDANTPAPLNAKAIDPPRTLTQRRLASFSRLTSSALALTCRALEEMSTSRTTFFGRTRQLAVVAALLVSVGLPLSAASQELSPSITSALQSGDTAAAISALLAVVADDPAAEQSFLTLGSIYFSRSQYELAEQQYRKAVDLNSKNWEAVSWLGKSLVALERLDDAQTLFEDARKRARKEAHIFENGMGLVYMARKQYSEAQTAFSKAVAANDKIAEYHINLGDAYFYADVAPLAISSYEKALKLDEASTEAYFHWAEACLATKDYNCAIEKLGIVLKKDSSFAPAWRRAGEIYFKAAISSKTRDDRTSRFESVLGSYKRFFTLANAKPDSANVRPYFELGMAFVNLNAFDSGMSYFDQVLAIPFEPRDIYFWYGKALAGARNYEAGFEKLQQHLAWVARQDDRYVSTISDAELNQLIGDCAFFRKPADYAVAAQYYEASLAANPDQKRIIQNLAGSYYTLKQYGKAMAQFDRRIALGVDSAAASVYRLAGFTALAIANRNETATTKAPEPGDSTQGAAATADFSGIDSLRDYRTEATRLLEQYVTFKPDDSRAVQQIAAAYLYQFNDCENGVKWYKRLLALEPGNCAASKSLGLAYFNGKCGTNTAVALDYLQQAWNCATRSGGGCKDVDIPLSIAQCYHLRGSGSDDFKQAYEWYGRVLDCNPNHAAAKKGQSDVKFLFN